ncbi:PDR/VanB family oxidoreductase [Paeniglutamicibacter cryotolerans]|uniref:Vanillate O-demethylase ferredoxin subunit n=1 Tax=Paeniglutamicibacter cryotolerans TaxID=670079 RepID=A0A839QKC6_9MICC|nr:PDR/VanB family oxidoreductase [Paeniglutamicibacter cryotolerans]MBB2994486.1 vanillate O-demethylase ferredoxin subunit [Paeniglutamicibacter cryotolerans]
MAATNIEIWQSATIIRVVPVAEGIMRIVLEPSLPIKAEPGSHIDLKVTIDGQDAKRSYSVVDSSDDGGALAISVMLAPLSRGGSVFMHGLEVGDRLEVTQPLQNFPLRVGAQRYLLLAGGIGITAIANMAAVLKRIKADYTLVYVGRNRNAMAYLEQLQAEHGGNLEVHVDDEGTSLNVPDLVARAEEGTELYMCGPIRLMDAVRRTWTERELDLPSLRYETFGNSGWYDPEEFIVRVPRLDLEVTVPQGRSMLEALEDAGAEMMFDCRKGECGLCEVQILSLEGRIDHRDVFFSERQQRQNTKLNCCVSRAVTSETGAKADAAPSGPAVVTIGIS